MSMDYEQMCAWIREMSENSMIIVSDDDREFILGLSAMLEIGEAIPASYGERIARIHLDYEQNQHL